MLLWHFKLSTVTITTTTVVTNTNTNTTATTDCIRLSLISLNILTFDECRTRFARSPFVRDRWLFPTADHVSLNSMPYVFIPPGLVSGIFGRYNSIFSMDWLLSLSTPLWLKTFIRRCLFVLFFVGGGDYYSARSMSTCAIYLNWESLQTLAVYSSSSEQFNGNFLGKWTDENPNFPSP